MPHTSIESLREHTRVSMRVDNEYSNDLRVRREAEAIAEAGYDITVFADARPNLPDVEIVNGVRVVRLHKRSRIPFWSLIEPLAASRADIYHAHDVASLFPCLVASGLARGGRVIYDSHELWSAHARDKVRAKRRVLIRFEGFMLRASDALISVAPAITSLIAEKYRFRGPAVTVMNVPRTYSEAELASAHAARGGDPRTVIASVGVFQHGRGAVPLVESLAYLPKDVVVEFTGPIPQPDYEVAMRTAAAPYGDRVVIHGRVPAEELVPRLAAATLSAVLIEPVSESYRLAAPNKLFDSLAAGTPVIASDLPVIAGITRETGAGVLCDPTDPRDIARAVLEALPRVAEMRDAARAAAARYNWDAEKAVLIRLYDSLISRHVHE